MILQPVDSIQRRKILDATESCLRRAAEIFGFSYEPVAVSFDLTGRAVGQYRVDRKGRRIRYNPYLCAKYFVDTLNCTVPHEVAHYVVERLYRARRVRPHGEEWKRVMRVFGAPVRATVRYDLSGVPMRRQQRFPYRCSCNEHSLSSVRHNRVRSQRAVYLCRACGTSLVYAGS